MNRRPTMQRHVNLYAPSTFKVVAKHCRVGGDAFSEGHHASPCRGLGHLQYCWGSPLLEETYPKVEGPHATTVKLQQETSMIISWHNSCIV